MHLTPSLQCSLEDFMGYLLYVSHEAENLQFYLWLQDYTKSFDKLPQHEQVLSPPWNSAAGAQENAFVEGCGARPVSRKAQMHSVEGRLSPKREKSNLSFDTFGNDNKSPDALNWQPCGYF